MENCEVCNGEIINALRTEEFTCRECGIVYGPKHISGLPYDEYIPPIGNHVYKNRDQRRIHRRDIMKLETVDRQIWFAMQDISLRLSGTKLEGLFKNVYKTYSTYGKD